LLRRKFAAAAEFKKRRGAVVEVDDAVGEGFGGEELEAGGTMARLNEGDAFADEDGERRREQ